MKALVFTGALRLEIAFVNTLRRSSVSQEHAQHEDDIDAIWNAW
jgi:hypothetical protein